MVDEGVAGSAAGAAALLYTEAVVEALRRRGLLDEDDIQRAFIQAYSEASKLPLTHAPRQKVIDVIGALQVRLRGRARRSGRLDPEPGADPRHRAADEPD
jgi:hypothetical protein